PLTSTLSLHDALPIYGGATSGSLDRGERRGPRTEVHGPRNREFKHRPPLRRRVVRLGRAQQGVPEIERIVIGDDARLLETETFLDRKSTRLNSSHVAI